MRFSLLVVTFTCLELHSSSSLSIDLGCAHEHILSRHISAISKTERHDPSYLGRSKTTIIARSHRPSSSKETTHSISDQGEESSREGQAATVSKSIESLAITDGSEQPTPQQGSSTRKLNAIAKYALESTGLLKGTISKDATTQQGLETVLNSMAEQLIDAHEKLCVASDAPKKALVKLQTARKTLSEYRKFWLEHDVKESHRESLTTSSNRMMALIQLMTSLNNAEHKLMHVSEQHRDSVDEAHRNRIQIFQQLLKLQEVNHGMKNLIAGLIRTRKVAAVQKSFRQSANAVQGLQFVVKQQVAKHRTDLRAIQALKGDLGQAMETVQPLFGRVAEMDLSLPNAISIWRLLATIEKVNRQCQREVQEVVNSQKLTKPNFLFGKGQGRDI